MSKLSKDSVTIWHCVLLVITEDIQQTLHDLFFFICCVPAHGSFFISFSCWMHSSLSVVACMNICLKWLSCHRSRDFGPAYFGPNNGTTEFSQRRQDFISANYLTATYPSCTVTTSEYSQEDNKLWISISFFHESRQAICKRF